MQRRPAGFRATIMVLVVTGAMAMAMAQQPTPPAGARSAGRGSGMATPYSALHSPEVHPDRTVTLRFLAPDAAQVDVVGEILQGKRSKAMTKGEDGIWTVTLGPLPPEIWSYNFRVQGVDVTDPANPAIKPVPPGFPMSSFVEVPGDTAAFYDAKPVPHGEVRMVLYESKTMGVARWLWIYTPPDYDKSRARYPVLYLLHGNGEAQNGWVMNGRANIILDNLIADGKGRPMIVVMPQGHALQGANVGPLVRLAGETDMFSKRFAPDLLQDVLPLVERNYRVYADADHRAIAGLSMGGGQALSIGLRNPQLFHYVLGYSAAVGGPFLNAEPEFKEVLADPGRLNSTLHLLWIGCGKQDFLYQANRQFAELLKKKGVNARYHETEGSHVWSVWRRYLNETAPLLFKPKRERE